MTYVPRVGDRVRATGGENVLVGEVARLDGYPGENLWVYIEVDVATGELALPLWTWSFEQIIEPMSFNPFAIVRVAFEVVRRSIDDAFDNQSLEFVRQRTNHWFQFGETRTGLNDKYVEHLIREGQAVLLFEGVAE